MRLRARRGESVPLQRGFALIALLALAALISAFLIASALNLTSAGNTNEREQRSMNALRQAKTALIAYAANEQWQKYKVEPNTVQPGALPCPDIVHTGAESEEGDSDCVTPLTSSLIGRLPYKTLGINDLRDASGEQLWYALSANFRKASGITVINSDTQPCDTPACNPGEIHLTVTGIAPASNVVAIVFAPGEAILGQTRSSNVTDAAHNNIANYLENFTLGVDGIHHTFATTALPSDTFNDRLLVITQADLMAAVEPVVAARIERDVKLLVLNYFTKWGAYPFAMTFAVPPSSVTAYQGASGQTQGLLPLTDDPNWFKWWKATVTQIPPGYLGTEIVTLGACSINSPPPPFFAVCHIKYKDGASTPDNSNARPDIKIQIFLQNANTAFGDIPSPITLPETTPNFRIDADGGGPVTDQDPPYGYFSKAGLVAPTTTFATQTAVVAETGVIVYTGRLQNSADMGGGVTITIPLPTPKYLPIVSGDPAVNPTGSWFISNQWYRQTFYAVAPDYLSGGGGNCVSNPPCLTVKNLSAPLTNGKAILILAGRSLNGTARPSANPKDYLEGENCNLTPGKDLDAGPSTCTFWTNWLKPNDNVYEHRLGVPTTINDRVVVVSP